ncbi:LysM peptidoglycan-binding domain-containing protein [Deinococcus arenicola]|uniref:LysM peptidoglycan-binding domain-containing protein n=1 Tax=Deinococcus arenicola TaxID=2994950 RepID=A0ABU4DUM5_9DEIO|nr:LysM peptidoglycan-binding domain-containing protein [Deinococcus sp. ZS9-10]MDV6376122.1 LysM peptidoglycan-binding domain-containing protein [Deinococcus sp. ZS9-10]
MWPFGKNTADRVKDALKEQDMLKDLNLQVQEKGGNVTVTGAIPNEHYVTVVKVVAEGINGVKSVDTSGLIAEAAPVQPAPQDAGPSASDNSFTAAPAGGSTEIPASAGAKAAPAAPDIAAKVKEMEDRSKIAKAVYQAIRNNGELKDNPIDVLQSGKSVILRGVVDNDHEQRLAEKLARAIDGVSGVDISGLRVAEGVKELTKEKDQDSGDTVYTVQSGDTLGSIAQKYFGNAAEYKKIAHFNNISNPDLIKVGQQIRIPG